MKKDFDLIAKWVQGLLKFEAQPPHNPESFDAGCKFWASSTG